MKVAKEQALVREKAAELVKDGQEVPWEKLAAKYEKTIEMKVGGGKNRWSQNAPGNKPSGGPSTVVVPPQGGQPPQDMMQHPPDRNANAANHGVAQHPQQGMAYHPEAVASAAQHGAGAPALSPRPMEQQQQQQQQQQYYPGQGQQQQPGPATAAAPQQHTYPQQAPPNNANQQQSAAERAAAASLAQALMMPSSAPTWASAQPLGTPTNGYAYAQQTTGSTTVPWGSSYTAAPPSPMAGQQSAALGSATPQLGLQVQGLQFGSQQLYTSHVAAPPAATPTHGGATTLYPNALGGQQQNYYVSQGLVVA